MDILTVMFLVFLEGMLSLDNAVVLALTVKHLPHEQQQKALYYGIGSAFVFRIIALLCLNILIKLIWLKVVAAAYLIWIGGSHFMLPSTSESEKKASTASFWKTIVMVELLDIVFSMDSIFAAVGTSTRYPIMVAGGICGIIMMRFAAKYFIILVEKFKPLESMAYFLVIVIGIKLGAQVL